VIVADYIKEEQELTNRIAAMEAEIITLKNKSSTLENWVKKVSESAAMH
jgi:hypothetical protein